MNQVAHCITTLFLNYHVLNVRIQKQIHREEELQRKHTILLRPEYKQKTENKIKNSNLQNLNWVINTGGGSHKG